MGAWVQEFDTGLWGQVSQFVWHSGDLFAFVCNGTAIGVWRHVPPNWVRVIGPGLVWSLGRGAVWNGQMWWTMWNGVAQAVYRSIDGIAWVEDWNPGPGGSAWGGIGGFGSYLYAARIDGTGNNTEFYRRDKAGAWVNIPPDYVTPVLTLSIMPFGSYVYWGTATAGYKWNGTAWVADYIAGAYFTVHNNLLYASMLGVGVFRKTQSGDWRQDGPVGVESSMHLSVGGDGDLYSYEPASYVYRRAGGRWRNYGAVVGGVGCAAGADTTDMFAAAIVGGTLRFYIYVVSFDVSPIGGGRYPQAMDCDGDGDTLYLCAYNAATQPLLIGIPLPLTPTTLGIGLFNPGAGSAINVKCSAVGQKLAISGRLSAGGNDSVQTSEDGGGTWTDIAPNWGDTAQPLLVDPDTVDEVYVALDAAQDLDETVDGGTTWIQRNAAVGYSPGAMAKLPDGDELVVGNDAANRIDYSPNRGQTLTNITGVFAGNVAALEVV